MVMGIFVLILHFPVICLCFPMVFRLISFVRDKPFNIALPRGWLSLVTYVVRLNHDRDEVAPYLNDLLKQRTHEDKSIYLLELHSSINRFLPQLQIIY